MTGQLSDEDFGKRHDKIDSTKTELMLAADKKCRTYMAGAVDYSPKIILWKKKGGVWRLLQRHLEGTNINRAYIKRMAKNADMTENLPLDIATVIKNKKKCYSEFHRLKPKSAIYRRRFLYSQRREAIEAGNNEKASEIKNIINKEHAREMWRSIKNARQIVKGNSVREVTETIEGSVIHYKTQEEVESAIMSMCKQRFLLTEDTPLMNSDGLCQKLGYLGNTSTAENILDGRYTVPKNIDKVTKELLHQINEVKRQLSNKLPSSVSLQDYKQFWRTCKEKTSSSFSGLHFGHYKACATNDYLASIQAKSIDLCFRTGIPLRRWSTGLTVMIEKLPGVTLVNKLRAILLMEADFNFGNRLIIGKKMVQGLEKKQFFPPDSFGSRNNLCAIEVPVCRALFFDVVRQRKYNAALGSYDAQSCYDRVVHSFTSMVCQSVGVPQNTIDCMLKAIQKMRYYVRTAFGDSTTFYDSGEEIFQGLCQGNGAAPALWLLISSFLLRYLKKKGCSINIPSAISGASLSYVALVYVDDGDFPTIAKKPSESIERVTRRHQRTVKYWSKALHTSGGALTPSKCFWYPIQWKWRQGKAYITEASETKRNISAPTPEGIMNNVEKLDSTTAKEVMGVWQTPTGCNKRQIEKMQDQLDAYYVLLDNAYIPRHTVWRSFWSVLWAQLKYSLPAISLKASQCSTLFRPLYKRLLPTIGISSTLPLAFRHSTAKHFGLGLPSLHLENNISKISLLQTHYQSDSLVSKHLHTSIEQLQLEIGTDNPFTTCSYTKYGPLATDGWLKTLWLAISDLPIKIIFRKFITIHLQRINDQLLLPAVISLQQFSSAELTAFNRVRLYLQVITIADIYTGEGTKIRANMLSSCPTPILSSYRWPVSKPTKSDFRVWEEVLEHLDGRFTLGKWLTLGHSKPDCFYDTEHNKVYIKHRTRWKQYLYPKSNRCLRLRSKYQYNKVVRQIPTTFRGTYTSISRSTIIFEGAQEVSIPNKKSFNTLSDIFNTWGETWIWKHLSIKDNGDWLAYALHHGTAILVCDGSFQPRLTTTKGTAAWAIKCTETGNKAIGTAPTPTEVANAYRSELLGLYAAMATVLAVTTLHKVTSGTLKVGCDNEKALYLSSLLSLKVPAKLQHSDILRSIMVVRNSLPLNITFKHISAHQDDTVMYSSLDNMSQLNVDCDLLAKSALVRFTRNTQVQYDILPHEQMIIYVDGKKVTGDIAKNLRNAVSHKYMQSFLNDKGILHFTLFNLIHWESCEKAMEDTNHTFYIWAVKQISGHCGVYKRRHTFKEISSPNCPICNSTEETARHQMVCKDSNRIEIWNNSVKKLKVWLIQQETREEITYLLSSYIAGRGDKTACCISSEKEFSNLTQTMDKVGWYNFMEGKIPKEIIRLQEDYYRKSQSLKTVKFWGPQLVLQLLGIVRTQWLYRCEVINKRDKDGLLKQEASLLRISIRNEYRIGDTGLLDEDKYLFSYNLSSISKWHIDKKKTWIHAVKVARAISRGEIFTSPAPLKKHQLREIIPNMNRRTSKKRKVPASTTNKQSKRSKKSTTRSASKRKRTETSKNPTKRQKLQDNKRKRKSRPDSFGVTKWKKRKRTNEE